MGLDHEEEEEAGGHESAGTLCLHAFSDLTYVSPVVFLYLLKECYIHGSCKATKKFQALQYRVHQVLANKPQPGPATFIVLCLNVLPVFGTYGEGFSHLVISALRRYFKTASAPTSQEDISSARRLAARLFLDIVGGSVAYDEKVMVNVLKMFDVELASIGEALSACGEGSACGGIAFLERYISDLIKSKCFMTAVSLLEHFSFSFPGETFLQQMVEDKDFQAAEKWATFMGKPSLCILVQECGSRNMLKQAYNVIKKNNLQHDFPDLCYKCKESALKDLAEKACWDVAERKAKGMFCKIDVVICSVSFAEVFGGLLSYSAFEILDTDASEILDTCLCQILHSCRTLKLGYNFQCDLKQLVLSYGDLECFKRYDMLLDIQNVFQEPCGGLSGLTKKILGVGLNKTRRNSDWEQRPLTQNQLEYAALDAAVLVHIFRRVRDQPPHDNSLETVQWKSHIVSHMDNPKKSKKKPKCLSMQNSASTIDI